MKASTIIAATGLAALASAAPVDSEVNARANKFGVFEITDFNWGCTVGCDWLFNVTIPYSGPNHRPVNHPAQCQGQFGSQKGYVACTATSKVQQIEAYVGKTAKDGGAPLFLKYVNSYPAKGSYYTYYGNTTVYSQTGSHAGQQKKKFNVPESSATAVA